MISGALMKLQEFVKMEMSSDDLQKPPFDSYARIVHEINEYMASIISDQEIARSINSMVREQLEMLVVIRIGKIMRMYRMGREIPNELLMTEERRLLTPLLELGSTQRVSEGLTMVSFRNGFPQLKSVTLAQLGPFEVFDVAALPGTDASTLRDRGVVDIIA
ncbi:hypothetical protein [Vulcanisaeta thermophila]|uniref:hypothetical protein n=1 Tax=Vulcanisaeta thermophila TaxID=867917 RepID=UPI003F76EDDE